MRMGVAVNKDTPPARLSCCLRVTGVSKLILHMNMYESSALLSVTWLWLWSRVCAQHSAAHSLSLVQRVLAACFNLVPSSVLLF